MRHRLKWVAGEDTPIKVYVTRVFNYGTWEEWQAMKCRFSSRQIKAVVTDPLPGQWTKPAKNFAEALYSVRMPDKALVSYHA